MTVAIGIHVHFMGGILGGTSSNIGSFVLNVGFLDVVHGGVEGES
jgi:hypothetical protein